MFSFTHRPSPLTCHLSFAPISLKSSWKATVQTTEQSKAFRALSDGNMGGGGKSSSFDNNGWCVTEPGDRLTATRFWPGWALLVVQCTVAMVESGVHLCVYLGVGGYRNKLLLTHHSRKKPFWPCCWRLTRCPEEEVGPASHTFLWIPER